MASPAVRDGRLYLGDFDGRFHCFEAATGEVQWKFETEAEIDSSANFYQDNVLVGSQDATLYCLRPDGRTGLEARDRGPDPLHADDCRRSGVPGGLRQPPAHYGLDQRAAVAQVEIKSPTGVTPAVLGDLRVLRHRSGRVLLRRLEAGQVVWTFAAKAGQQPYRSSAAVSGERVVVGGRNKRVQALDAQTGRELWTFATRQRVDSSPVIAGQRVFVGAGDGRLYALDLRPAEVWEYEAGGGFIGSPAIADGRS